MLILICSSLVRRRREFIEVRFWEGKFVCSLRPWRAVYRRFTPRECDLCACAVPTAGSPQRRDVTAARVGLLYIVLVPAVATYTLGHSFSGNT